MSFLTTKTPLLLRAVRPAGVRAFTGSAARSEIREGNNNRDAQQRKDEIDQNKKESVEEAKRGKGEWKEGLASQSEAAIKADKAETGKSGEAFKEAEKAAKKFKQGS